MQRHLKLRRVRPVDRYGPTALACRGPSLWCPERLPSNQSRALCAAAPSGPTAAPRRCALLVACEYLDYAARNVAPRLPGCHMDIKMAQKMLIEHYGYTPADFVILSDESSEYLPPTRANILAQLEALTQRTDLSQVLLYYSGHGTQTRDTNGDELDGMDEALVPCDYLEAGLIVDDTFHQQVWSRLPLHVVVTCIFDCCNSGTIFDLPYRYEGNNQVVPSPTARPAQISTPLPLIVTISGCRDSQTSASAYNLAKNFNWEGALSYVLRETLKAHDYRPVGLQILIEEMRQRLQALRFSQVPQLGLSRNVRPSAIDHLF